MPVATQGTVKSLEWGEIFAAGYRLALGNTLHLYLRPGTEVIEKAGGLHGFTGWQGSFLTDSGGYQVFSLETLRVIGDDYVVFRSPIDGSEHRFTPEFVLEIQDTLRSDIAMVLDECSPYPCSRDQAAQAMERTYRWATASKNYWERASRTGLLFGICQGAFEADLRGESAQQIARLGFDGCAIGGLSVGEDKATLWGMLEASLLELPPDRPRYLMGVGLPSDIARAVSLGVDMFDCVLPTRMGRTGTAFTSAGRVNLRNALLADQQEPLDPACSCLCCRRFSRAYLRHLFRCGEMTGFRLVTLHNLTYYSSLMRRLRTAILTGSLADVVTEEIRRFEESNA
jgi:queuine tRNA-ribosyltransferase